MIVSSLFLERISGVRHGMTRIVSTPASLFLLWALWLSWPFLAFGPYSYVRLPDNADSNLAGTMLLAAGFLDGSIGAWNPFFVAGTDTLATSLAIPFNVLVFVLPPDWLAYGALMFLQRFVAGYFTFRLLRDHHKLGASIAASCGAFYAMFLQPGVDEHFDGFTLTQGFGICGIPLWLWATISTAKRTAAFRWIGGALIGILFAASTFFATAPFIVILMFQYVLVVRRQYRTAYLLAVGMVSVMAAIILTLLRWPILEYAATSHRTNLTAPTVFDEPLKHIVAIAPELLKYNAVPLAFALGGLALSRRDPRLSRLLELLVLNAALLVAYGVVRPWLDFEHVGPLKAFNFQRIYVSLPILAVLASAHGARQLLRKRAESGLLQLLSSRTTLVRGVIVVAVVGVLAKQSYTMNLHKFQAAAYGLNHVNFFHQPAVKALRERTKWDPPFRVASVAFDWPHEERWKAGFAWTYGLEAADGYVNLYSARYHRLWGRVILPTLEHDENIRSLFRAWGCTVYLFLPEQEGLAGLSVLRPADFWDLELLSLLNVRYVISPRALEDSSLREVSSTSEAEQPLHFFQELTSWAMGTIPRRSIHVYLNENALPRAYAVNETKRFETTDDLLEEMQRADLRTLSTTLFISESENARDLRGGTTLQSRVEVVEYGPDRLLVRVDCSEDCALIVTNSFDAHWQARVDGRQARLYPANYAFQGLDLPSGRHDVELRYIPGVAGRIFDASRPGGRSSLR